MIMVIFISFFKLFLCFPGFLQWVYNIYKQNTQTAFKFLKLFTWKKIQVDMILMWLWEYLYQLINSSEKGMIIQLDL